DAVLDRAHAGLDGVVDALAAERVHHHALAPALGLEDRDLDLLDRELGNVAVVVRREDAAGGAELDPVGSRTQRLAYDLAHVVDSVDDAGGPAGKVWDDVVGRHLEARARQEAVDVSARLRHRYDGDLEPGAGHVAARDGVAHAGVGAARVAHEG